VTHEIPEEHRESFERFIASAKARWEQGGKEYGNRSYCKPPRSLLKEVKEELLDVVGWAAILVHRVEELEQAFCALERVGEMLHSRATTIGDLCTHLRDLCEPVRDAGNCKPEDFETTP
jgi:hypothetical protein